MSWEILGALSDLFAAVAVVASLLYLSRQLRMTREVSQVATFQGIVDGFTEHSGRFFAMGDELALRGLKDRGGLTEAERLRFDHQLAHVLTQGEMAHSAVAAGLMQEEDMEILDWWFRERLFCYPGAREWLGAFSSWYPPAYRERLGRAASAAAGSDV